MWCWGHPVSWGLVTKPSPLVISTILLLQLSWLKMPNPTEIRALSHAAVQEKSVEMLMWSSMQEPREWEGSTGLSAWEQSGLQGSLRHGWTWHPGPLKHWALCHGPLHRLQKPFLPGTYFNCLSALTISRGRFLNSRKAVLSYFILQSHHLEKRRLWMFLPFFSPSLTVCFPKEAVVPGPGVLF